MITIINESLARQISPQSFEVVDGTASHTAIISNETKQVYASIFEEISRGQSFDSMTWKVVLSSERKPVEYAFPEDLSSEVVDLLKCWVVYMFTKNYVSSTIRSQLLAAYDFFHYLGLIKLPFTALRATIIANYLNQLEENQSEAVVERATAAIESILHFASVSRANFTAGVPQIAKPTSRTHQPKKRITAPDQCVLEALDLYFFDFSKDIPSDMRCIYLLLRLISNRISEVLAMPIDCIRYPTENVFSLLIGSRKTSPFHRPIISEYSRRLEGRVESTLYAAVQQQRNYAQSKQEELSSPEKGFLCVSTESNRLVTTNDVNSYLETVCQKEHIFNANGEIAKVTSHQLRHANITAQLNSSAILPAQVAIEANHVSANESYSSYYGTSPHDSGERSRKIMERVYPEEYDSAELFATATATQVDKRSYDQLLANPLTRIIPGVGVCINVNCTPRFERCLDCQSYSFTPNPLYREYFEEALLIVNERIIKLEQQGRRKNQRALNFNRKRKKLYEKFLELTKEKP